MKRLALATAVAMAAALAAPGYAADQPTIPVIVKDTTSGYWQIVFAGARKAGQGSRRQGPRTRRPVRG